MNNLCCLISPSLKDESGSGWCPAHWFESGIKFVTINAGTFNMGEDVQHEVTLTRNYDLGVYPVTQQEYQSVMKVNPSQFENPLSPVETVSWDDLQKFIEKLNQIQKKYFYRLPTEGEWEYACRAGTNKPFSFSESKLDSYAWFDKNAKGTSHPVGQKKPNRWGLYDMHGNIWEWCQDWYADYPIGKAVDPFGPKTGSRRVIRGGSWYDDARLLRSARRNYAVPGFRYPGLGVRLVRSCC
jgi:formylglycine-generating enzyme required for sulfatase activity